MEPKKRQYLKDCGIVMMVMLFPHFVPLPFYTYAIVCFIAILAYLRSGGLTLADLGLRRTGMPKAIAVGLLSAVAWVAFMRWIFLPFITAFFDVPQYTEYDFIKGHPVNLAAAVAASWIVGGFYEEIAFRGVLNRVASGYIKNIGGTIVATSLLFGLYHCQQGIFGVVAATLGGLYWNILYYRFGKDLWPPMFSHAFFDTITLTLIYFGLFGK